MSAEKEAAVKSTKAYYCVECGKCTGICPVSRGLEYSPRRMVKRALEDPELEFVRDSQIWNCLTCKLCSGVCPSGVDYIDFIRIVRSRAHAQGLSGSCSQGGQLSTMARMMASDRLAQGRNFWTEGLEVAEKGELMYFVGCLPYFDTVFEDLRPDTLDIARSTVKVLNAAGIRPVVSPAERCCGHDLLWSGDVESYRALARQNIREMKRLGVKTVVTSCAECYRTLSRDYKEMGADLEVKHISQLAGELLDQGKLKVKSSGKKVTLHDACRLGRHTGVYDPPREVLRKVAELVEMPRSGPAASCCGVGAFLTCGAHSKRIQVERLIEAGAAAPVLVTECPKCQIHFKCALRDKPVPGAKLPELEIIDLSSFLARNLEAGKP
ncbi:MAG: (Fe-S)-binding protein [Euryarchaeota archaeon]|nr:(Fe-S)-binding protein [Euryarchaeota archaeon]